MTHEVEMCEYQLTHCIIEMETGGSIDREKPPEVTLTSVDSADHSLSRRNSYSPHWLGEVCSSLTLSSTTSSWLLTNHS